MILIQSTSDWWNLVRCNENVVLTLISRFHPLDRVFGVCPVDMAVEAIENRDHATLRGLLGETWFGTAVLEEPEAIPGVEVLYALCNEAWVLDEIEELI